MADSRKEKIDIKLIRRAQEGDIDAFEKIISGFQDRIFYYCLKYLLNSDDAEDVTQEVFIKLHRKLKNYNQKSATFSTWLFTIAKNTTYDWLRKRQKRKEIKIDDLGTEFGSKLHSGRNEASLIGNKIDIEMILDKIRPEQKRAIKLFYWMGYSYKEIAKIMKIPINSVRTYISRAKKSIAYYFSKK